VLGERLGKYEIVRELGAGGMGTVYLGENGDERVAIKVVHPHLIATPGFFKRFLREAELGKQVNHECVVRTLDVDATMVEAAQVNYIVMAAFSALLCSLSIIYFVRRAMTPLKSVISDMGNIINTRDFSRRVEPFQNDEIGELASEFNLMSEYLDRAGTEVKNREQETLDVLSKASDLKDPETDKHTTRVGLYASFLSELRGDTADEIDMIRWAAPLHDVGKLGTPDKLLLKTGRLTDSERQEMMTHAQMGHDILIGFKSPMLRAGAVIAISHHERWNGTGYPNGLKGDEIPITGRITGLVDVFDALTTERPYKKAWTPQEALDQIKKSSGSDFDPEIVEIFVDRFDRILEIFNSYGSSKTG
jgi:HD-GYP domain-containing protein (c-di-GMP phosphodiesterase class II)